MLIHAISTSPTRVSYRGLLLRGGDFPLSLVALPRYDVMLRSGQSRVNVDPDSMRWELDPGEDMPLNRSFQFQKRRLVPKAVL